MNQTKELEELKSIKRKARFSYHFFRNIYNNKSINLPNEERKIYLGAISALDEMSSLYQALKTGMRKNSISDQIKFARKWENYIYCIEAITAYKTKNKYLHSAIKLDEVSARYYALKHWANYKKQFQQKIY